MQTRRRRSLPPWERRTAYPRHPVGNARRRWPRAYDGGTPPEAAVRRRYRRSYDGDQRAQGRRGVRNRSMLDNLRQNPLRHGLIGLAVAGAATPVAVNRYQQAMRTDASHERIVSQATPRQQMGDAAVANAWRGMESERNTEMAAREQAISSNLSEYADFPLSRELAEDIYDMAQEADIDPEIAFGLVRAESSFKNTSTSRVGAVGLTQLMPSTARWLEPGVTRDQLRNPETNLRIGFRYLKDLIEKYDGDVELALTAYNRGPGTVDRVLRRGGNPDNGYADFVKTGNIGSHKG
jgi:soluble lytic murein transglycosylase-like protein